MKRKLVSILFIHAFIMGASAQLWTSFTNLNGLSLQARGGIDVINDVNHCDAGWGKSLHPNPQFGVDLDYNLNKKYGFGIAWTFAKNNQWNYDNTVQIFDIYGIVSLANILSPGRDKFFKKLNTDLLIGVGESGSSWKNVTNPVQEDYSDFNYPHLMGGLNIEYNLNQSWALGLNGRFLYFFGESKDYESKNFHPTREGGQVMCLAGMGLRYKFGKDLNIKNQTSIVPVPYSEYSKWSVEAHGGSSIISKTIETNFNPAAGLQLEYDFNPIWGLALDYTWAKNDQKSYESSVNNAAIFASVNMMNLFYYNRQGLIRPFSAYVNLGVGESFTNWKTIPQTEDEKVMEDSNVAYPHFLGGVNFEYNISKNMALGLQGQYRYYYGEPMLHGAGNCFHPTTDGGQGMFNVGVGVRYKIGGEKNIRNCPLYVFQ